MPSSKSVIVIGAGIAGLSAGIYAQMNGYHSRIFEMHNLPGGLMTAWKRKGYTIDGCIHWLTGSSPKDPTFYRWWQETGLIQGREIFDPEEFVRVEGTHGEVLHLYCDVERLEPHLLELAPEDRAAIREMCSAIRAFTHYRIAAAESFWDRARSLFNLLPVFPSLMKWGRLTMADLAGKFKNPFLRKTFHDLWYPSMSCIGLMMTLAMMHNRTAGYTMGGSLPMALAVEKRYRDLGGQIQYNARVSRIIVENNRAAGVRLEDGREERADVVISAADGYATLYQMLEGRYRDPKLDEMYRSGEIFQPLVFIGLGVNRTFPELPGLTGGLVIQLDEPFYVAGKPVHQVEAMIYNFDPSLAPPGKTVLTVMIPTEYAYWKNLYGDGSDCEQYEAEKQRVALEVIRVLDRRFAGLAEQVEMADVATPLTFERYTGNWQGSFEGWLPTPKTVTQALPKTLPGLENFYMVGQWVQPGGGLPSGVMTGREVIQRMCKQDGIKFTTVV